MMSSGQGTEGKSILETSTHTALEDEDVRMWSAVEGRIEKEWVPVEVFRETFSGNTNQMSPHNGKLSPQ